MFPKVVKVHFLSALFASDQPIPLFVMIPASFAALLESIALLFLFGQFLY